MWLFCSLVRCPGSCALGRCRCSRPPCPCMYRAALAWGALLCFPWLACALPVLCSPAFRFVVLVPLLCLLSAPRLPLLLTFWQCVTRVLPCVHPVQAAHLSSRRLPPVAPWLACLAPCAAVPCAAQALTQVPNQGCQALLVPPCASSCAAQAPPACKFQGNWPSST